MADAGAGGVRHAVCVGGGVIGSGWAARFALAGVDVTVYDPSESAPEAVAGALAAARRAWGQLAPGGGGEGAAEGEVRVIGEEEALSAALGTADFVQESLPEREDVKRQALEGLEAHLAPDVVIASSTSGLLPSRLQAGMAHPRRFCVGHPFTPVYLLPLVEVCGGEKTAEDCRARAVAFYRAVGMAPLVVRREIDGFVADRLMEALWREALWLVHDDVATAGEIDDAIRLGCGLRWAFMGPFLTYRLGGGAGGMRHFMAQFGPALKLPWTKLMEVPELDVALLDKIVAQSEAQVGGGGVDAEGLARWRDDCLVRVMRALEDADTGVGRALEAGRRLRGAGPGGGGGEAEAGAGAGGALRGPRGAVVAEWIDYNGHMTEARYLQVFGEATDVLLAALGVDAAYVAEGRSFFTAETHLRHLREAKLGEWLEVETQVLGGDGKRLHVFHVLRCGGEVAATAEQLLLHVAGGRAAVAEGEVAVRLREVVAAHAGLAVPEGVGRFVGQRLG